MTVSINSPVVGQAEYDFTEKTQTGASQELGKETFLTLLLTQLEHQDPLQPMADTEFTAQLAQFSSLEELENISKGIESMNQSMERQDMLSAASFIGKQIRAEGNGVAKEGGQVSTLYYTLEDTAAKVYINIFDPQGNLVDSVNLDAHQPGTYGLTWDGLSWGDKQVPDGVYTVYMAAEGVSGEPILVDTEVSGEVAGVQTYMGNTYLRLKDGRMVDFMEITEVVNPGAQSTEEDV